MKLSFPERKEVPLLDISRGNDALQKEYTEAISKVCSKGCFVGGPICQAFENEMAALCGTDFAVGCASGSDALLLALMAIDVGAGDEVIVPSFTFFATVSAVTRLGATPVFIDIDPDTFNMNPGLLRDLVTPKTKAIIPVHLFGQCADMDAINEVAVNRGLFVIEDAAQAVGATYHGRAAGGLGHMACFSFYPTKNLGGFGDGGLLTTDDEELANRLRLLANHGMSPRYYHQVVGINSRLDAIQAAVLRVKLKHLQRYQCGRSKNAAFYTNQLQTFGLQSHLELPTCDEHRGHVWNQYTIRVKDGQRDNVRERLLERRVGTEIYYPIPMHQQSCFQSLQCEPGSLSETEKASQEVLSLPIFPELTELELRYVVDSLCSAVLGERTYKMTA